MSAQAQREYAATMAMISRRRERFLVIFLAAVAGFLFDGLLDELRTALAQGGWDRWLRCTFTVALVGYAIVKANLRLRALIGPEQTETLPPSAAR
jgi:hypothetical protein